MSLHKLTLRLAVIVAVVSVLVPASVFAQKAKDCNKAKITRQENAEIVVTAFVSAGIGLSGRVVGDADKAIAVSKNVYLSFCVTNAPVKINGWKRSEVRAFVKGRPDIGFKVREMSSKEKRPNWVELFAGETADTGRKIDSCISGKSVELDVPYGATVSITGESGQTSVEIDSIKKAKVDISSGDISMSHITDGLQAFTDVGGVSVRNSSGIINMKTTAGNIVAFETETNEIGDSFKAKTHSGAITMQSIGQKEVEASSISGSINYIGTTKSNGNYMFSTTNGIITLAMPSTAAFKLKAAYGGAFSSQLPLRDVQKDVVSSTVYLTGFVGEPNGATIAMRSYSGTIRLLQTSQEKTAKRFF